MDPVAFSIFGLDVRWYGVLISIGIVCALILSKYSCYKKDIDEDIFINVILIALPIGIIGARLYYVAFNWDYYAGSLSRIVNIREGGLAIHGGIIFGIAAAFIYLKAKGESFFRYADVAAPSIILAQAIGRWGNFFNQEAHGGPVSFEFISRFPKFIQDGMNIGGQYFHPTFLYESIWDVTICILLLIILNKSKKNGTAIFSYVGLYSIGRYFIEGLRTDSLMLGNIRVAQLVSLVGIIVWLVFCFWNLIVRHRK